MNETLVLGLIQGIAEWLPVSSEGLIVLARVNFFGAEALSESVKIALFLHLGTFFSALVYFRKDVWMLTGVLLRYRIASSDEQALFRFIAIATLLSGVLGAVLLLSLAAFENVVGISGKFITGGVGALLLFTAYLNIRAQNTGVKHGKDLVTSDSLAVGIAQGIAALPGLSRSGLTIATLLLRGFDDEAALRLSFLLSMPIVLAGNIALNFTEASFEPELLFGALIAFLAGLATIHGTIVLARKIVWGKFLAVFGVLMILAAFL